MSIKERMKLAGPIWSEMADRFNQMINLVNALRERVFSGSNPHLQNDGTNVLSVTSSGIYNLDTVVEASHDVRTKYEAHRASGTFHPSADSTNTVTDTSVISDSYALLNELKTDYNAHRVLTAGSVHSGADSVNVVDVANATTKATAIALANQLRSAMLANFANVTSHHIGADSVNIAVIEAVDALTSEATWSEIAALTDALRTAYEAHRQATTGIHGAADSTNTVSAAAVGAVQTSANSLLNELKTDFNAHIILMTSHVVKDDSMKVEAANASSLATSITLAKELVDAYADHITSADELSNFPEIEAIE